MREIMLHLKEVDIRIIIALVRTEAARCREKARLYPTLDWEKHVYELDALGDSLVKQSRLTA